MSESDNSFNESMDHPLADHPLINIENLSEPGTASLPLNNDINAVDNVTVQGDLVCEETVNDNNNVVPSKNNRSKEIACIETPSKKIKLHCNPIHEEFNFSDGYSVCIHCKTKLKGKNTNTLINHVQKKHLGELKELWLEPDFADRSDWLIRINFNPRLGLVDSLHRSITVCVDPDVT